MNNKNQILEKKLAMLFAEPPEKSNEKQLSPEDKKIIEQGLGNLFFGLAWANWLNGATLGSAWHRALEQVDSFIATKDPNNPATKHLRDVASVGKSRMSKIIMTSPNADKKIECPPEQKAEWAALGIKWTNQGLQQLNAKTKEFEQEKPNMQKFQNSQQNIINFWMWQNNQSRAA